ncbi:TetR/AcrR family transcriptional regulator [Polaribacter sejongensis]|uniref:TetR/AcrR family transcriptional regulator n=1 Tax=Polaribacter sejongensis TaxID=985043 RepID=UPI001FC94FF1|nr:TetR/AcrR family transcriptional regulator [Polaribacter sejongensis]
MENRIINKSAEMFLKHGFKSVTMDDIALEMGISKKTIYKYFKNKKELIKIVITQLIEKISYGIDFIFEMNLNPIDKLFTIKDFVTYYLKSESSSPFYSCKNTTL